MAVATESKIGQKQRFVGLNLTVTGANHTSKISIPAVLRRCRQPRVLETGLAALLFGDAQMIRVACYVDGFNVYHAVDDVSRASRGKLNFLKWFDLKKLMTVFTDPAVHTIVSVKYFSAYATWMPGPYARHQLYVAALENSGVDVILGKFKEKDVYCKLCKGTFKGHEEKESDVNLACHLTTDAFKDVFDQAFIVSRDSDLSQPIRFVREHFPQKRVKIIAPPMRGHSKELWALANSRASINIDHLKSCLFAATITDAGGKTVCVRPPEYKP